ncbi:hypothetical protein Hypma_001047 [Hypsizygus marmoreus]|uniref:Uncharacterized protein n=1 Tax=Hypsizygus marmoreus TaxID=39966 RepID=A0A369J8S9_HYPMA|nr:hypothetical protein Hypma_001047 [Hypsizygus marmoreus]
MAQDLLALANAASNALDSDIGNYDSDSDSASDSDTNFSNTIGCATAATAVMSKLESIIRSMECLKVWTIDSDIRRECDTKLVEAAYQKEITRRAEDLYMAALHDVDTHVTPEVVAAAHRDYAISCANSVAACAGAQDCLDRIHQHDRSITDEINVHILLLRDYALAALASIDEPVDLDSHSDAELDSCFAKLEQNMRKRGWLLCQQADLDAAAGISKVEIEGRRYIQNIAAEDNCYFKRAEAEHHVNVAIRDARIANAQAADVKKNIAIAKMEEHLQQLRLFKCSFSAALRFFRCDSSTCEHTTTVYAIVLSMSTRCDHRIRLTALVRDTALDHHS